jgi:hypothetical protein
MLTHVHKVKHLVVDTFDQGWQSWRRGAVFTDRTLVPKWPDSEWCIQSLIAVKGSVSVWDQTLHSDCDRTCRACVQSEVMYDDVVAIVLVGTQWQRGPNPALSPVMLLRTRQVAFLALGELFGSDWMPRWCRVWSGRRCVMSLVWLLGRRLEQTLGDCVKSWRGAFGRH